MIFANISTENIIVSNADAKMLYYEPRFRGIKNGQDIVSFGIDYENKNEDYRIMYVDKDVI
jgi:hypothetical protein